MSIKISIKKSISPKLVKNYVLFCDENFKINGLNNLNLKKKIQKIKEKLNKNLPTLPTTIKDEIECNIFLRTENLENFSKLRDLKDNF